MLQKALQGNFRITIHFFCLGSYNINVHAMSAASVKGFIIGGRQA